MQRTFDFDDAVALYTLMTFVLGTICCIAGVGGYFEDVVPSKNEEETIK